METSPRHGRGNILSKDTYAYTTGTLGTVQNTDSYEYFEQSSSYLWGDGLVRYNGGFNVYDAIGTRPSMKTETPSISLGKTVANWQAEQKAIRVLRTPTTLTV